MVIELNNIHPFNNGVDTGLRILTILNAAFPVPLDLQTLLYYDYLTVHAGDISSEKMSLHPSVPTRKGEILVRRALIQDSIEMFISKGLIVRSYIETGLAYCASESATPFIESLSSEYSIQLSQNAAWVIAEFLKYKPTQIQDFMQKYIATAKFNLDLNLIHNE